MKSPEKGDHYWYDENQRLISEKAASKLLKDHEKRLVKATELTFMGHKILVSTIFVPVDHNPYTWSWQVSSPSLWITEILGGPEDINGVSQYYESRELALVGHDDVVAQAIASGCVIA